MIVGLRGDSVLILTKNVSSLLLGLLQDVELLGVPLGLLLSSLLSSGLTLLGLLHFALLLSLHLVDRLDEHGLVLELVTLGSEVEVVVDFLGDLLGLAVLSEQASENALSPHPEHLLGHSRVLGTLPLTEAGVAALSLGLVDSLDAGSGVHVHLALHDDAVLQQLPDVFSCSQHTVNRPVCNSL
jgi:hypothetical protein